MKTYQIRFEIFGHFMVTDIEANSQGEAEYILRGKLRIMQVTEKPGKMPQNPFETLFNGKNPFK